jgi:hypothetical protein
MTTLRDDLRLDASTQPGPSRLGRRAAVAVALGSAAGVTAALLPDVTSRRGAGAGAMTHYMGLLAANQPWNLLIFMAVPVILAETLAITELALLFRPDVNRVVHLLNRWAGLVAGVWFVGIAAYLVNHAAIPLTTGGDWRGAGDLLAVGAYLSGVVPLGGIALIELGLLGAGSPRDRARLHATFVGIFLVVAHVAMIFGMLDPSLLGWQPAHHMPGGDVMPGMTM